MNYHFFIAVIWLMVTAIPCSFASLIKPAGKAPEVSFTGTGISHLSPAKCTNLSTGQVSGTLNFKADTSLYKEKTFHGFNVGAHIGMYGVMQINTVSDGGGIATGYFASYLNGKWITTLEYNKLAELTFLGPYPAQHLRFLGIMSGINHDINRVIRVSLQTGVAYGAGRRRTDEINNNGTILGPTYYTERFNSFGWTLKGRYQISIFKYTSIGLSGMLYYNKSFPAVMFNVNLTAGILKKNRLKP